MTTIFGTTKIGTMELKLPRKSGSKNKKKEQAKLQQRLQQVWNKPENQYCIDCDAKNTTFASILAPVPGGSRKMSVFTCYKCCNYHMTLGRDICQVKNLKTATDWTDDEIKILEACGNDIANVIYEGNLTIPKPSPSDHDAQQTFIYMKYKQLEFLCMKTYKAHLGSWIKKYVKGGQQTTNSAHAAQHAQEPEDSVMVLIIPEEKTSSAPETSTATLTESESSLSETPAPAWEPDVVPTTADPMEEEAEPSTSQVNEEDEQEPMTSTYDNLNSSTAAEEPEIPEAAALEQEPDRSLTNQLASRSMHNSRSAGRRVGSRRASDGNSKSPRRPGSARDLRAPRERRSMPNLGGLDDTTSPKKGHASSRDLSASTRQFRRRAEGRLRTATSISQSEHGQNEGRRTSNSISHSEHGNRCRSTRNSARLSKEGTEATISEELPPRPRRTRKSRSMDEETGAITRVQMSSSNLTNPSPAKARTCRSMRGSKKTTIRKSKSFDAAKALAQEETRESIPEMMPIGKGSKQDLDISHSRRDSNGREESRTRVNLRLTVSKLAAEGEAEMMNASFAVHDTMDEASEAVVFNNEATKPGKDEAIASKASRTRPTQALQSMTTSARRADLRLAVSMLATGKQ